MKEAEGWQKETDKIHLHPLAFKHGFTKADALDELMTHTDLKLGPNGTGGFSKKGYQMVALDEDAARILNAKSIATHRSPSELVADLVHDQFAVAIYRGGHGNSLAAARG